ncbi:hypothetical protein NBRC116597_12000 [Phaeobacter sp. NW0010-22]
MKYCECLVRRIAQSCCRARAFESCDGNKLLGSKVRKPVMVRRVRKHMPDNKTERFEYTQADLGLVKN